MDFGERHYFSNRVESKPEEVEQIRQWLAGRRSGAEVAVNFGGGGELENTVRDRVKAGGGKYLVVDPGVTTSIEGDVGANLRGGLVVFVNTDDVGKIRYGSSLDELELEGKVDMIELNYVLGNGVVAMLDGRGFLEYLGKYLSADGRIVIRNSLRTVWALLGVTNRRDLEEYGWKVETEGVVNGFDSEYYQMMKIASVELVLRRRA